MSVPSVNPPDGGRPLPRCSAGDACCPDQGSAPPTIGRALVLGGGYTGGRFALALAAAGVPVQLSHRQPEQARRGAEGALPVESASGDEAETDTGAAANPPPRRLCFDPDRGLLPEAADLEGTTHLLVTIPPDRTGHDPVLEHLGPLLERLPLTWVGYLSTTGVYGDQRGGWVDESSPVQPGLERSRARLACEEAWRSRGLPLQVFRLPAIYGPGRVPFRDLRQGTARLIHKPGQVFCRVHVEDIVGALLHMLALDPARRPETLILADEAPCPSSETLAFAAHLLGCGLPEVQPWERIEASLSPMARSFWSENRRVSSRLLREGLGYRLRYPTYREGYRACLAGESGESSGEGMLGPKRTPVSL